MHIIKVIMGRMGENCIHIDKKWLRKSIKWIWKINFSWVILNNKKNSNFFLNVYDLFNKK